MAHRANVSFYLYTGLDEQTLQMVMQDPDAQVKIVVSYPDPDIDEMQMTTIDPMTGQPVTMPAPMLHDVQVKRVTKDGRITVMAVPPEELLLDRRARSRWFRPPRHTRGLGAGRVSRCLGRGGQ